MRRYPYCHAFSIFLFLYGIFLINPNISLSSQIPIHSTDIPDFSPSAELDLRWSDQLTRPQYTHSRLPGDKNNETHLTDTENDQKKSFRSMGLSLLRLEGFFRMFSKSQLYISLRPDALITEKNEAQLIQNKTYDSRAGQVYQKRPTKTLLESYHIAISPGRNCQLKSGVIRELKQPARAYPDLLEFGLQIHLPENFFAASMAWVSDLFNPVNTQKSESIYHLELTLFHGNNDRVESFLQSQEQSDTGPATTNPYGGFSLSYQTNKFLGLYSGILLGYHEDGSTQQQTRSFYSDLFLQHSIHTGIWISDIFWNIRYFQDNFYSDRIKVPNRHQISLSLTNRTELNKKYYLLSGFLIGKSDFPSENQPERNTTHFGHQIEAGMLYIADNALSYQFMIAEEHRQKTNAENRTVPGFSGLGFEKKMIRRFSLSLNWALR